MSVKVNIWEVGGLKLDFINKFKSKPKNIEVFWQAIV